MRTDAESSCTASCTDSWSQDGARNPWSAPTTDYGHPHANNLVKRVKRAAFGFTNFDNYRIRALLYAGKPNWTLLDTLTPP